jgi:N-acetylmuramoyl-L-alanine amidase
MPADLPLNLAIRDWPLPYAGRLDARDSEQIDLVVIHCTELPDLAMARDCGERVLHAESQTGNSGHYYIDRDGAIVRFVQPERIAHHTRGYNPCSIGIELVNTGRYPDWFDSRRQAMDEPYTEAQIGALIALLKSLRAQLPNLQWIAGHEDLDTAQVPASDEHANTFARKRDPGPLFPWPRVLAAVSLERLAPA